MEKVQVYLWTCYYLFGCKWRKRFITIPSRFGHLSFNWRKKQTFSENISSMGIPIIQFQVDLSVPVYLCIYNKYYFWEIEMFNILLILLFVLLLVVFEIFRYLVIRNICCCLFLCKSLVISISGMVLMWNLLLCKCFPYNYCLKLQYPACCNYIQLYSIESFVHFQLTSYNNRLITWNLNWNSQQK